MSPYLYSVWQNHVGSTASDMDNEYATCGNA